MKKKLLLLLSVFVINICYSQNYAWITPNKTYLKMYVAENGMYRIDKTDFTNAGINANSIDPRTVKVYSKGNQQPIFFSGEQDGTFDVSDYFDFYGTRNNGGLTSTYDHNNNVVYTTNEYYNSYSDTNIYWVDWGGANGLRYTVSGYSSPINYPNPYFSDLIHFERDYFYYPGENLNSSDLRFLSTEKFRGEGWYWSALYNNQTLSDTFSAPDLYTSPQTASLKVYANPTNRNTSIFNEHSLQISVNGNLISTLYSNDMNRIDSTVSFSSSLLSNSAVNTVSIKYVPAVGYSGYMYIDFFEIQYPKIFRLRNSKLYSNTGGADTTSRLFNVSGYNSASPMNIYDVNNNMRISTFTGSLDTLKFTAKSNAKFEFVNSDITKKPIRIKQKSVPDLVNSINGADYLIIYHNSFLSQAEQLRAYRQSHDNFRSFKADIEDIYDVFNFGLEDPIAVRNFTSHVYNNWQIPKLSYICLLGRASLDPKKINSTSSYYKNLVPTYGYPPSDGYFANFNIGTFCYYHQIAIGRLPAYSVSEAQTMVDKIIAYESQSPADWSKDFIFITGGGTISEQNSHQSKSNSEISQYIIPPSISGDPHKIYRSDISGVPTFNLMDSVKNDISRGALYVNYRGHAGSHDWEVGMNDPNTLSNGDKLPVVLSLTCFTGENSKSDYRGFGERFIYLPGKGAIGFVGTTGWSYAQYGNDFGTYILIAMKMDTARRIGNLTKYAQTSMSEDSLSFSIRHTLNCYGLIGDPAVKLNLPVRPELSVTNADFSLSNNFPNIGDNVNLSVSPKNFGLHCDSAKIRMQLKKDNQNYYFKDTIVRSFGLEKNISFNLLLDSVGLYTATVTLDFDNWIPLEYKGNNILNINIPVKNTAFVPLRPVNNSVINSDSVEFSGLNPRLSPITNSIKVILQMDTSTYFNSPVLKTFVNSSISGVTTKFKTSVPVLVNNKVCFWRTNCIINNDSSGWSGLQTFVYNNTISSFSEKSKNESQINSNITVIKNNPNQYSQTDYYNTTYKTDGIELSDFAANLFVRSLGSNAEESSYFSVGDKNIYIDGGINSGLNILKVNKVNGNIQTFKNFKMNSGTSNDSLVTFLNTFDTTQYMMLLNAAYVAGGVYLNAAAKNKLKQFGSIYCDSITLISYFHTWSLIGYLGANSSQTSEKFDPCCRTSPNCTACDHWTESVSNMPVTFKKTSGTVSSIVGPAQSWTDFSWTQTLNTNSTIAFDVYGININNQQVLLLSNLQNPKYNDLSTINANQYPKLNLVAKFNIDTTFGKKSSVLNSLNVNFTAPIELTWDVNSLKVASDYRAGESAKLNFVFYNSGYTNLSGLIINLYKKSINSMNFISTDTLSYLLKPDSLKSYSTKFIVPYFRDSMRIIAELRPKDQNNEFYLFNNNIEFTMNAVHLNKPININVYSDNQVLNNGDYVAPKPEIKITISDPDRLSSLVSDTAVFSLNLNNNYVPYYINGKTNSILRVIDNDNMNSGNSNTVMFYPVFLNGKNNLSLYYNTGTDNSDTVSFDVFVSDELAVKDLYNYPNPMKNETSFIFNLAGSYVPEKFKIKIYTVSGKLIKQIESPVNIGNNKISWDGKDDDGDLISNGTYLYKLVTEDDSQTVTQTQKLVVLR